MLFLYFSKRIYYVSSYLFGIILLKREKIYKSNNIY